MAHFVLAVEKTYWETSINWNDTKNILFNCPPNQHYFTERWEVDIYSGIVICVKKSIWITPNWDSNPSLVCCLSVFFFQIPEFDYKNDSVLVVDKKGYYHCVASNPISSFSDGKTIYKLEKPGLIYFISGVPDHCKNGQRLIVDVMALHPSPHPGHHPDSADSPSPSPLPSSATMASSPTILLALATLVLLSSGSAMLQWTWPMSSIFFNHTWDMV